MPRKITDSTSKTSKLFKPFLQYLIYPSGYQKHLMIMGCQRSGTTLISNVLDTPKYTRVYGEFSPLSDQDPAKIRLNTTENILCRFNSVHAPLVVTKPLVESQNARELLSSIPNSYILWAYRNYKDVALSDIKKFRNIGGHGNILAFVNDATSNWRNEHASLQTIEIIKSLYSTKLKPIEAASLFWYARNILFFEQKLAQDKYVSLWSYDDFVKNAGSHINNLMRWLDMPQSNRNLSKDVFVESIGTAKSLPIDHDIDALCSNLQERLDSNKTLEC